MANPPPPERDALVALAKHWHEEADAYDRAAKQQSTRDVAAAIRNRANELQAVLAGASGGAVGPCQHLRTWQTTVYAYCIECGAALRPDGATPTHAAVRDEATAILAHEPVAFAECTVAEDVMARARRILELLT
jgi:hypothetical protein